MRNPAILSALAGDYINYRPSFSNALGKGSLSLCNYSFQARQRSLGSHRISKQAGEPSRLATFQENGILTNATF